MKVMKFFAFLAALSTLGYLSFYITYESVSAIVMKEAEENKKNEIVIKPMNIEEDEEENPNLEVDEKKEILNVKTNNFIFIGDSRLDSMKALSNNIGFDSVEFITTENPSYYWMVNEGVDSLDYILKNKSGNYNIVFNIGVNDLDNVKVYIEFLNSFADRHPAQNIFVLGIGPLDETKAVQNNITHINNDDIYNFNIDMIKGLDKNVHVLHVFQELINNGYDTTNGYYLTEDTSMSLLTFIYNEIKKLEDN